MISDLQSTRPPHRSLRCAALRAAPVEMTAFSKDYEREPGAPSALTGRAVSDDVGNSGAHCELIFRAQSSSEGALTGITAQKVGMSTSGRTFGNEPRAAEVPFLTLFESRCQSIGTLLGQTMSRVAPLGKPVGKATPRRKPLFGAIISTAAHRLLLPLNDPEVATTQSAHSTAAAGF